MAKPDKQMSPSRLFMPRSIRIYELLFVLMASLAMNLLAGDLRQGAAAFEILSDIAWLASALAFFYIFVKLSHLWEDKLRGDDPHTGYKQGFSTKLRSCVRAAFLGALVAFLLALTFSVMAGLENDVHEKQNSTRLDNQNGA